MRIFAARRRARLWLCVAAAGLTALTTALVTAPSRAVADPGYRGANRPLYLALGDSVTFGYREPTTTPPPNYTDPSSFVGYPEDVASALGWEVANAACPGETSLSFTTPGAPSNGCENSPGGGPGYRTAFPLHVSYSGTQLQYAVQYLRSHPWVQAVSLMIGANDAFLCQETTADHCASEVPTVISQVQSDVSTILGTIRRDGHYRGQIVVLNYYSLDYANPTDDANSQALNQAQDAGAAPYGATIADGYGAFQAAATGSGGDSCKAGLLTQLSTGGCGVHPTAAGQAVLALAVEEAIQQR